LHRSMVLRSSQSWLQITYSNYIVPTRFFRLYILTQVARSAFYTHEIEDWFYEQALQQLCERKSSSFLMFSLLPLLLPCNFVQRLLFSASDCPCDVSFYTIPPFVNYFTSSLRLHTPMMSRRAYYGLLLFYLFWCCPE